MQLRWTASALSDLTRLYDFLVPTNPQATARAVQALVAAAGHLANHPRIGRHLAQYPGREVRRTLVAQYELRYEIRGEEIIILRFWHTREKR